MPKVLNQQLIPETHWVLARTLPPEYELVQPFPFWALPYLQQPAQRFLGFMEGSRTTKSVWAARLSSAKLPLPPPDDEDVPLVKLATASRKRSTPRKRPRKSVQVAPSSSSEEEEEVEEVEEEGTNVMQQNLEEQRKINEKSQQEIQALKKQLELMKESKLQGETKHVQLVQQKISEQLQLRAEIDYLRAKNSALENQLQAAYDTRIGDYKEVRDFFFNTFQPQAVLAAKQAAQQTQEKPK
jgi:hypothetical protein